MRRLIVLGLLILAVALAGCGAGANDESPSSASGDDAAITLPDGWAMTDALSAEDVAAVTGKTMEVFPEASSAAQDGRPAGGYTATGVAGSKIYFGVDVQGGEAGYASMLSFAEPDSAEDVSGVGDQAAAVAFSDGRAGIIARKGDAVIRVDWDPAVYAEDPAEFGAALANALLARMYQ